MYARYNHANAAAWACYEVLPAAGEERSLSRPNSALSIGNSLALSSQCAVTSGAEAALSQRATLRTGPRGFPSLSLQLPTVALQKQETGRRSTRHRPCDGHGLVTENGMSIDSSSIGHDHCYFHGSHESDTQEMSPEDTPHLSIDAEVVGQGTLDIVQQSSACSIPEMSPENPPHLSSEAERVGLDKA
ncbi:uncharacterized protein LOC142775236 isoform X2 [Rhipicephalus microplus]